MCGTQLCTAWAGADFEADGIVSLACLPWPCPGKRSAQSRALISLNVLLMYCGERSLAKDNTADVRIFL